MPIEPYTNETQTQWDRGNFRVMVQTDRSSRPLGFCEGTSTDEAEIHEAAESEGTTVTIEKKLLKTGREIWTVHSDLEMEPDFSEDF